MANCFSRSEFDLGRTSLVEHGIETAMSAPIRQALRRQPIVHLEEIDRQLTELERLGIIEPRASPWASNLVVVTKKDGSLRMCVDYRGLNNLTRKDSYPLPRITDCLDALGKAKYFSTFDLRSGYFQIAMEGSDRDKTSFITRRGSYRFTAMPFGLCNAPATFQRLMDVVTIGLNYEICLVYLDDIILFSRTIEEHLLRLKLLLNRLRGANLKLKPSKCFLLQRKVNFLGHVISEGSIATDPEKIEQVRSWPRPQNTTETRSFIGLVIYYRRFVNQFAKVAAPLHALAAKNAKFIWTEECEIAFEELKKRLITSPILAMPNDDGEFRLDTDASNYAIGAVLSQVQNAEERVIAYASRTLRRPERNYCVTRKELLAVVHFTSAFRPYLLGRDFLIRTDHSALRWLKHTPEPIGQQARWLERLEAFNFRIEHRPGTKHGNADALSRGPCRQGKKPDEEDKENCDVDEVNYVRVVKCDTRPIPYQRVEKQFEEAYEKDTDLREIYVQIRDRVHKDPWESMMGKSEAAKTYWQDWDRLAVKDGKLFRKWYSANGIVEREQLIVPKEFRETLLRETHGGMTGGHLGVTKTSEQIQRRMYWFEWRSDVRRFVHRCVACNRYHRGNLSRQGLLQTTAVGEVWERIAIDLTGPHNRSRNGNVYILTVIDLFSKWVEAIPIKNKEAITVSKALFEHVISRFGIPVQILSDGGMEFEGSTLQELCRLLEIDKIRTTAYN